MSTLAQAMKRMTPSTGPAKARSKEVSRTKEIAVEAGERVLSPRSSSAASAKTIATTVCPVSFSTEVRPRLRCLEILV